MENLQLYEMINNLGIQPGDIILVSSNIMRLAREIKNKNFLNSFIDFLQNIIGNEGTLLFPTYNWDFCRGLPFDYYKTPSMTGSLSKVALQRDDFKRTKHPIYSFAVWGKYQNYLCSLENKDSFGENSPFGFLYQSHAKNLMIDVDYQESFTFLHYVEESVGVDYRYKKSFTAHYIDENHYKKESTYSMYVRNLNLETENNINPIGRVFECRGVAKTTTINSIVFVLVDLYSAYDIIRNDIVNNRSKQLVTYKGQ